MLNQGDVVQPGTFSFASSLTNAFVTANGSFGNGIDKYIGINAGSHYGWIKVNVPATPHPTWVLKGYAINTQLATQITCDGVLPVELTSFTVELLGTSASLLWNTATEVNNYGFDIERNFLPEDLGSAPSVTEWEKIGFVPGNGNSNSPKAYSFIDPAPPAGLVMYRLKQIDNDGAVDYSQIVTAAVTAPKEFVLEQNFPNPFNPVTEIKYSIPEAGFVTLIVYDMLGKEVASLVNGKEEQGSHSIRFDASNLPSGTYMFRLTAGSFTETKKLMLLK